MTATQILYDELLNGLKTSNDADRIAWAKRIAEEDVNLKMLCDVLFEDKTTAMRFAWLLTGVGQMNKQKLSVQLPYLLSVKDKVAFKDFYQSLPKYWLVCDVPEENEGEAMNLLFDWLVDPKSIVSLKTNSLLVLQKLAAKYPELKNEIRLCIEDQLDKNSISFTQVARTVLAKM